MILVIVFIWAFISKVKHNIQQESKKEIKKAIDNIVIKQPIVKEIFRIAQTNTNVLKLASLIIKKNN